MLRSRAPWPTVRNRSFNARSPTASRSAWLCSRPSHATCRRVGTFSERCGVDAHTEVDDVLLKDRPRVLVAACDGYIEPAIKFAHGVHRSTSTNWQQLVVLGGDTFPFRARPSTILVSGMPA